MHGHTLAALRVPCRPMHQDSTWPHIKAKDVLMFWNQKEVVCLPFQGSVGV